MTTEKVHNLFKAAAALLGLLTALLAFTGAMNEALLSHLDKTFATKQDLQSVERKVDILIDRSEHGPQCY